MANKKLSPFMFFLLSSFITCMSVIGSSVVDFLAGYLLLKLENQYVSSYFSALLDRGKAKKGLGLTMLA